MNITESSSSFKKYIQQSYESIVARLPFILISLGVILRIKRWLENRSLWIDEAYLGMHIMATSWKGILLNQRWAVDFPVPPMGFMLMEKINAAIFGNNEMALRLFPLCCGILAIVLFYVLTKKILTFRMMVFALALFVLNDYLIEYSSELKQYSTDMMVVLTLSLLFLFKTDEHFAIARKDSLVFVLAGMVALTFSHVAIFVLAAFGICQQAQLILSRRFSDAMTGVKVGFWWILAFSFWYSISLSQMSSEPELIAIVKNLRYMINVPLWSLDSLKWFGGKIVNIVTYAAGLKPFFLAALLCIAGTAVLARQNRKVFFILFFPLILAFCAAGAGRYLLGGRFSLFMVPAILIGSIKGVEVCFGRKDWRNFVVFGFCGIIFFSGLLPLTWQHFRQGQQKEEARELVRYFQKNYRKQDALLINEASAITFWYYLGQNGVYQLPDYILMSDRIITDEDLPHVFLSHVKISYDAKGYYYGYPDSRQVKKLFMNSSLDLNHVKRLWIFGGHMKGSQEFVREYFERKGLKPVVDKENPGAMLMMYEGIQ